MEEYEEVVLIATTDLDRLEHIKRLLEGNNIPYVYDVGFCNRHNSEFVKKKIIVNSLDYNKAKKIIADNDEFLSDNAKIINPPNELKDLDEGYFKKIEEKKERREKKENIISKIILYIILIIGLAAIILNIQ